MVLPRKKTLCPYCREEIQPGALVCRHCHSPLNIPKKRKPVPFWRNTYMLGVYSGIALMILLIILYSKIF